MTIARWLISAVKKLEDESGTARLDAQVLLCDAIDKNSAWLLTHPDFVINKATRTKLDKQIQRRAKHEPLAYVRGKSEFYGRTFKITPATLQPRPETETIVTRLKSLPLSGKPAIVDVGTGSGAIAITAKLELPHSVVYATEIQAAALKIAQKNAQKLGADIQFYRGDLIEPLQKLQIDIVLANLPYVPNSHTINQAAMQEPAVAIFGGEDGLDLYRQMFDQIRGRAQKPQYVICESLPFQHKALKATAAATSYVLQFTDDFIQVYRYKD